MSAEQFRKDALNADGSPKEWLNTEEAAKYMGRHPYTVQNYCRKKKIPFGMVGVQYRFKKIDLDAFIAKNGSQMVKG